MISTLVLFILGDFSFRRLFDFLGLLGGNRGLILVVRSRESYV